MQLFRPLDPTMLEQSVSEEAKDQQGDEPREEQGLGRLSENLRFVLKAVGGRGKLHPGVWHD